MSECIAKNILPGRRWVVRVSQRVWPVVSRGIARSSTCRNSNQLIVKLNFTVAVGTNVAEVKLALTKS